VPVPFPFARLNALQPAVNIPTVYQTHVFAKLHKQNKNRLRLKKLIEALKSKGSNCNAGSSQVLGAFGNLSFDK
jgi:hypothetical protein